MRKATALNRLNSENRRIRAAIAAADPDVLLWGRDDGTVVPLREHPNCQPCYDLYTRALRHGQEIHEPWAVSFVLFVLGVTDDIGVVVKPGATIRLIDERVGVVPNNLEWVGVLGTFRAEEVAP